MLWSTRPARRSDCSRSPTSSTPSSLPPTRSDRVPIDRYTVSLRNRFTHTRHTNTHSTHNAVRVLCAVSEAWCMLHAAIIGGLGLVSGRTRRVPLILHILTSLTCDSCHQLLSSARDPAMSDDALPSGASSHNPLPRYPLALPNQANLRLPRSVCVIHISRLRPRAVRRRLRLAARDIYELAIPSAPPSARRATFNHRPSFCPPSHLSLCIALCSLCVFLCSVCL